MARFLVYEMLVFIFVIAVGYVYAWKKGSLDWDR
jgi:NADH:ubiquinone oxidoreductase subunit 3 (subunit A)